MRDLRRDYKGSLLGIAAATSSVEMHLTHRDIVTMAACTLDSGIIGLEVNPAWKRIKIHGVPGARDVGKGSLERKNTTRGSGGNEGVKSSSQLGG